MEQMQHGKSRGRFLQELRAKMLNFLYKIKKSFILALD